MLVNNIQMHLWNLLLHHVSVLSVSNRLIYKATDTALLFISALVTYGAQRLRLNAHMLIKVYLVVLCKLIGDLIFITHCVGGSNLNGSKIGLLDWSLLLPLGKFFLCVESYLKVFAFRAKVLLSDLRLWDLKLCLHGLADRDGKDGFNGHHGDVVTKIWGSLLVLCRVEIVLARWSLGSIDSWQQLVLDLLVVGFQ
jgi:hypothetical protein